MRPVSNACSGEPGEFPDDEVNAHLENPGYKHARFSTTESGNPFTERAMSTSDAQGKANRQPFEKLPVIFHFQPTSYEIVAPERLGEWEKLMRERVGLEGAHPQRRLPTISFCGEQGEEGACDTDYR